MRHVPFRIFTHFRVSEQRLIYQDSGMEGGGQFEDTGDQFEGVLEKEIALLLQQVEGKAEADPVELFLNVKSAIGIVTLRMLDAEEKGRTNAVAKLQKQKAVLEAALAKLIQAAERRNKPTEQKTEPDKQAPEQTKPPVSFRKLFADSMAASRAYPQAKYSFKALSDVLSPLYRELEALEALPPARTNESVTTRIAAVKKAVQAVEDRIAYLDKLEEQADECLNASAPGYHKVVPALGAGLVGYQTSVALPPKPLSFVLSLYGQSQLGEPAVPTRAARFAESDGRFHMRFDNPGRYSVNTVLDGRVISTQPVTITADVTDLPYIDRLAPGYRKSEREKLPAAALKEDVAVALAQGRFFNSNRLYKDISTLIAGEGYKDTVENYRVGFYKTENDTNGATVLPAQSPKKWLGIGFSGAFPPQPAGSTSVHRLDPAVFFEHLKQDRTTPRRLVFVLPFTETPPDMSDERVQQRWENVRANIILVHDPLEQERDLSSAQGSPRKVQEKLRKWQEFAEQTGSGLNPNFPKGSVKIVELSEGVQHHKDLREAVREYIRPMPR